MGEGRGGNKADNPYAKRRERDGGEREGVKVGRARSEGKLGKLFTPSARVQITGSVKPERGASRRVASRRLRCQGGRGGGGSSFGRSAANIRPR